MRLSSSRAFIALIALGGCAHDAAPLPPVGAGAALNVGPLTDKEQAARCVALSGQITTLRAEMATIVEVMNGHRDADQAGGYLAAILFPPLLVLADQQTARKAAFDQRQGEIDRRLAEESALRCPSPPALAN
ncbi:MAG: hypothetical protein ACR2FH_01235 [Caulobacteraceae bacterium]